MECKEKSSVKICDVQIAGTHGGSFRCDACIFVFCPGTAGFDDTDANIINSIVKGELDDAALRIQEKINKTVRKDNL